MILFVSGATKTVRRYAGHPNLGCLLTPDTGNNIDSVSYLPWAADNAAFVGFKPDKFAKMLERMKGALSPPKFVSCPDVVGDCWETMKMFAEWEPIIRSYGYNVAFVLQDGQPIDLIPWDRIAAVFVGGSTEYKLGVDVENIVREAKRRGKWAHMGRVNTFTRIQHAQRIGCDSVDGTGFSMYPDTHIPWALKALEVEQITLF